MKLYNYLNEEDWFIEYDKNNIIEKIKKECSFYLNIIDKKYFFRRSILCVDNDFSLINTKKRNTGYGYFHKKNDFEELNNFFKSNKITTRDNSIFCSSSKNNAVDNDDKSLYFFIFLIGKFNYSWIKSSDFNISSKNWKIEILEYYIKKIELNSYIKKFFNEYDNNKLIKLCEKYVLENIYTNKNIKEAYLNKYEIWFDCKKYYAIRCEHSDILQKIIK